VTPPGRRLAIDYGRKRIGLAVCDALGITTRALPLLRSTTLDEDLKAIERHCEEERVEGIVIGVPVKLDGIEGRAATEVRLFASVLRERLRLPVEEVDERLTTKGAHVLLKEAGHRHARRKARLDGTAAMLILKAWLDRRRHGG
jgi:putative Holliday junction resolvase